MKEIEKTEKEIEAMFKKMRIIIFIICLISFFMICVLLLEGCAGHAQDCADMMYKYSTQYIFNNDQLTEQEKEASFYGVALGQKIDKLTGDEIAEIWRVYVKMKEKNIAGNPVEKWKVLTEKNELEQFLFRQQTQTKGGE